MRLVSELCLCALIASAAVTHAQEAGYLDSRSDSLKEPDVVKNSFGAAAVGGNGQRIEAYPLAITLEKIESVSGADGPAVLWTIRLKNTSDRTLLVPSSLSWNTTAAPIGGVSSVLTMHVDVKPTCDGKNVYKGLSDSRFYGSPSSAEGMVTVDAGEWVTVVGTGPGCPAGSATATYKATAQIASVSWMRSDAGLERSEHQLAFLQSRPVSPTGKPVATAPIVPKRDPSE